MPHACRVAGARIGVRIAASGYSHVVSTIALPLPPADDPHGVARWVADHLGDLCSDDPAPSPAFRGGQRAADAALAALDVRGYARWRNEVWPRERRGATGLSPWIRHGLLTLPRVWEAVEGGPSADVDKLRDELLWQEYSRHLYARLGSRLRAPLRADPPTAGDASPEQAWDRRMACMDLTVGELEDEGWVPNQARLWLAGQWAVRHGLDWREGEQRFFAHLLDGSRAANGTGWQWAAGTGTGRPYGFSRRQVERRAPGLCQTCPLSDRCPVEAPPEVELDRREADPLLRRDPDPEATGGPRTAQVAGAPELVWLTAESLGEDDPALLAHPDVPAVFVFDAPLLARLALSGKRLVFLAETLAELATTRTVHLWRGDPVAALAGTSLATTFAPVPGWRARSARLDVAALHPWPWLRRPHEGPLQSFTAWRKHAEGGSRGGGSRGKGSSRGGGGSRGRGRRR